MDNITPASKDFAAWYKGLDGAAREGFAKRAKTKTGYIESHLLAPYKIPRAEAMKNLAIASGIFTVGELAAWFYTASLAQRERVASRGRHAGQ